MAAARALDTGAQGVRGRTRLYPTARYALKKRRFRRLCGSPAEAEQALAHEKPRCCVMLGEPHEVFRAAEGLYWGNAE